MEASPLTQQTRPSSFQPKIIGLYHTLFKQEDEDLVYSDAFWGEFFLLRPDKVGLERSLDGLTPDDLLHLQHETRQLFVRAVSQVKHGRAPSDENALDTLTVFLGLILTKRYTNPSADIITVLAGLDEVDAVFFEFANAIESNIRTGRSAEIRSKAIDVALSLTSGAYQTSLVSYFAHRDLFPALMKAIQESNNPELVFKPFLLLGLLANYNKFEFRNPYRLRLEDFVNEGAIQKIVQGIGSACSRSRNFYVAIQEDVAEGWTVGSTLAYIGLGVLAPSKGAAPTQPKADDMKEGFANLPNPGAAVLLGVYDFTNANKVFCSSLVSCTSTSKTVEAPFSAFLSYTSYLVHHAYRSPRARVYGLLNFLVLRIIIEDLALCKVLCDPENPLPVRLCRQRQPFLPPTPKSRPAAAPILDLLVDSINHNLRRHLDIPFYISCIGLIHRLLSYLTFTRTRLTYHWSLLWQTLLSFLRFLTTYAPSLTVQDPDLPLLINPFLATLALAVTSGESFLPDLAAYDDLFYKLVEAGDYLSRFKKAFHMHLTEPSENINATSNGPTTAPIDILIQVAAHYHDLVEAEKGKGRMGNNMSPREVSKVIRQGYDTLSLPAMEGLDRWDRFREGDERGMLKRMARVAVEDTKKLLRAS
ncbi:MAG: hypothetical protein Q9161_006012 [Pseudevernia consocians]